MPRFSPGAHVGRYTIEASIGAGGMGEVYRAHDDHLGRKVALKVVPQLDQLDTQLRDRLVREARTVSRLSHPNICALYDLDHADNVDLLVMEYLEGESLRDRLVRGPLPLPELLRYARQIGGALDVAHRAGVLHRDLKPANIMLCGRKSEPDAKLLDFGVAKILQPAAATAAGSDDATLTHNGMVVGTPQYMSPEQIEGKALDARSDLYSFGAVLYEMAAGRPPFTVESWAAAAAAVLRSDPPDLRSQRPDLPPSFCRVVHRCLAKHPDERWQTAADLTSELAWIAEVETGSARASHDDRPATPVAATAPPARGKWVPVALAVAALAAAVVIAGWWWLSSRQPASATGVDRGVTRFSVNLAEVGRPDLRIDPASGRHGHVIPSARGGPLALSRDGARLVYRATDGGSLRLYLRNLNEASTRELPGTEGVSMCPFFSPDGQWVAFWANGTLKKISVLGGSPVDIAPTPFAWNGIWGADDQIIVQAGGTKRISASGGVLERMPLAGFDAAEIEGSAVVDFLPDRDLLVASERDWTGEYRVRAMSRSSGETRMLWRGGGPGARYLPNGYLVYADGTTLFAVPIDPQSLEPLTAPVPVLTGMHNERGNMPYFAISDSGTLAYVPASLVPESKLIWVNRKGETSPIEGQPPHLINAPSLSPDGRRVALNTFEGGRRESWILDLERPGRWLVASGISFTGVWSRDGQYVAYTSFRSPQEGGSGTFRRRSDGTGEEERLLTLGVEDIPLLQPTDWSPGDQWLALAADNAVWLLSEKGVEPLDLGPSGGWGGAFSPDGRFIAFSSLESGTPNIYVQSFPGPGPRIQVSRDGSTGASWGSDGREIFYFRDASFFAVTVKTEPVLDLGPPRLLFTGDYASAFAVAPDGERFLMITGGGAGAREIRVALNWFEELERLAPRP